MTKHILDFIVKENIKLHSLYALLKLEPAKPTATMPDILAGQFVEVEVPDAPGTFLRRPISVCNVANGMLWLLVRRAGDATNRLCNCECGTVLNLLLPLGNGFPVADAKGRVLITGGGVGVAPLLYLGRKLAEQGIRPAFLVGARTADDLLLLDEFSALGDVYVSTDNGSAGERGVVTENTVWQKPWDRVYCCGPAPMMKAVASVSRKIGAECFVSLENMMACGLGACLCCVEKTVRGNVCVCSEGPIFNINELTWHG